MMKSEFKKISVIGLGLIGTSILHAINAKKKGDFKTFAYDVNSKHRDIVSEMKIATFVCDEIHDAVKDADLVILAVPVGSMKSVAISITSSLKEGAIVTDTGSTKNSVIKDIQPFIRKGVWFIPSHPLAGTENSGPGAGFSELFKGKYWVVVPYCSIPDKILENFKNFLSGTGAIIETMKPEYHDKILAITSHLPHLIAYTIVGTATDLEDQTKHDVVRFSATGFRDFTRIASSDPIMWRDVFLNNKDAVLEMLQRFSEDLTYLQRAIRWSESDKLVDLFTKTREIRRSIIEEGQDQ